LRASLEDRGVHPAVLDGIRDESLRTDYYDAAFESVKLLVDRLRTMTSLDFDGDNSSTVRSQELLRWCCSTATRP